MKLIFNFLFFMTYNLRNQKKATEKGTPGSKRTRNSFECLSESEEPLKKKTSLNFKKSKSEKKTKNKTSF
jgi:hypothetical protein